MSVNFTGLSGDGSSLQTITLASSTNASPVNGEIWYDSGAFQFREGGSTTAFPESGETNTAVSLGGTESLVLTKSGVDLPFKGLTAGANVTLTPSATDITIDASGGGGGGEANTASNAGGDAGFFKEKSSSDLVFRGLTGVNGVTFTSGANDITINAGSGVFTGTSHPIAIGNGANGSLLNTNTQGVAVGKNAMVQFGFANNHFDNVAVGYHAMRTSINGNPAGNGVAVGAHAGEVDAVQDGMTVIGYFAGQNRARGIYIGDNAGQDNLNYSSNDVCIGYRAGFGTKGSLGTAIGYRAADGTFNSQAIAINATNTTLAANVNNGIFINPIRAAVGTYVLKYTNGNRLITYDTGKTFVIDHPTKKDKYLVHECIEGPEMLVYYRGRGQIDDDSCIIKLPDYCRAWYDFTIDVSPIGSSNRDMYCSEVENNEFIVYGSKGKFAWTVYAKRGEMIVEVDKKDILVKGEGPYTYME